MILQVNLRGSSLLSSIRNSQISKTKFEDLEKYGHESRRHERVLHHGQAPVRGARRSPEQGGRRRHRRPAPLTRSKAQAARLL